MLNLKNLAVEMQSSATQLSTIEIKGEKDEIMRYPTEISVVQLSPGKIESLPSLGEKDIMRSLQLCPE